MAHVFPSPFCQKALAAEFDRQSRNTPPSREKKQRNATNTLKQAAADVLPSISCLNLPKRCHGGCKNAAANSKQAPLCNPPADLGGPGIVARL